MRPPTPLQSKTPFEISAEPLAGITTSRAGLSAVSRVLRAINLPGMCEANLALKKRSRGFVPGQVAESLVLLHAAGGDCKDDMEKLREDSGLTKMLGYQVPSARCTGDFLALFHDEEIMNAKMRFRTLALKEKDLRQKLVEKYGSLDEIDALVGIII